MTLPLTPSPVEGEKTAHTPGPWKFQFTEESGECFIVAAGLGGLVGAALPWPTEMDSRDFRRVIVNARLIAAAPDLLEVCRAMYEHLSMNPTGVIGWNALLNQAEAAIRRAEGRDARKDGA